MSSSLSVGSKRSLQAISPLDTFSKAPRLELCGFSLVSDLIHKILSYLPFPSVLTFERTSRICTTYTEVRWKELLVEDRLDFEWSACAAQVDSAKYRYILGRATFEYVEDRHELKNIVPSTENNQRLQKIYNRFEGLMVRFPCFGAFVWTDLCRSTDPEEPLKSKHQDRFLMPDSIGGGELLLRGLSQLSVIDQDLKRVDQTLPLEEARKAFRTLTAAIQKNATCASFLAVRLFYTSILKEMYVSLSTLSIGKNNDYRGLDKLLHLEIEVFNDMCSWGCDFPPILVMRALRNSNTLVERDQLLTTALLGYGNHVPIHILVHAADTKSQLLLWKGADELYTRSIIAYGDQVPAIVLDNAAFAKLRLEQWEQADKLYTKAMIAFGEQVPSRVWAYASYIKSKLEQWNQADELSTKAITAYGNDVNHTVLSNAAYAKVRLKQWDRADELYTQAIIAYGDNVPPQVWAHAALTKHQLRLWKEADELYTKAITAYGDKVPPDVLERVTRAKFQLQLAKETEEGHSLLR